MYIADLHIHSKYSRATSRDLDAPHLDLWARLKGIGLVGTGDFTHARYREELSQMLEPAEDGFYRLRAEYQLPCDVAGATQAPRFVVTGEISTIYKRDGKTRKVHHLILLPSLEDAQKLSHRLEAIGNLHSDGRPILGLDSRDLLKIVLDLCPDAVYIPAHIWTPHFSLFGAFSGFDTLEECYGELSGEIRALETGLSSDPPMNRRWSALDNYALVSNSDAHSPARLGREANLIDAEPGYKALRRALGGGPGLRGTIEFFPEEGKYHLDGHRACACRLTPRQTASLGGICPVCGRKLTIGVLNRVEQLSDRGGDFRMPSDRPFESLMPLCELLSDCMGLGVASKKVQSAYFELIARLGPEFHILRETPLEEVTRAAGFAAGEALRRLRAGRVIASAGYDGEYGKISLFEPGELERLGGQMSMSEALACARRPRASRVNPPVSPEAIPAAIAGPAAVAPPRDALNERQLMAVRTQAALTAVVAGPGTGKTKTLVARIEYLIDKLGVPPEEITAVTFTNQSAGEMRARLEARLGARTSDKLCVDTFHAICMKLLDKRPLIGRAQALEIMESILRERGQALSAADCLREISLSKSSALPGAPGLFQELADAYAGRLREAGVRDLDDLLIDALAVDADGLRMFNNLLVDEFQDINAAQRRLVRHWFRPGRRLFVIGDPDQSIYGFRGADATCFEGLRDLSPDAQFIRLEQNYRSSPQILNCALSAIAHNPAPYERALRSNRPDGPRVRALSAPDSLSEGIFIAGEIARMAGGLDMLKSQSARVERDKARAFSDIAILCRTRRQLELIEDCLRHDSIPCVVSGRWDFLENAASRALIGFFQSLEDPGDFTALNCALKVLWHCPDALIQRVQAAFSGMGGVFSTEALKSALALFDALKPFVDAVEQLFPRLGLDAPRALLERLAGMTKARSKPVEQLLNTAVFHETMAGFLRLLTLGEEADIRRASQSGYASGAVQLMTLHAAKGLEFPVVFLAGVNEGTLPLNRPGRACDPAEERRLFFVGVTRAREELILSCAEQASEFMRELGEDVVRERIRRRLQPVRAQQLSFI